MKRRQKEPRPSQFEVAMEKGDFKLPHQLPTTFTVEELVDMYMAFWRRLGRPGTNELHWFGVWRALKFDRKATAAELGITLSALNRRIARLLKRYGPLNQEADTGKEINCTD